MSEASSPSSFLVRLRRLAALGHVPQTITNIHSGPRRCIAVERTVVIDAVAAHGIDDKAIRDAAITQRLPVERIGRYGVQKLRTKLIRRLRPFFMESPVALRGQSDREATKVGVFAARGVAHFVNCRDKKHGYRIGLFQSPKFPNELCFRGGLLVQR